MDQNTISVQSSLFPWMDRDTTSPVEQNWAGNSITTTSNFIYYPADSERYSFTVEKIDVGFIVKIFSYGSLTKTLAITKRKKLMKNMDFFLQYPEDAIDYWNTFKKAL